MATRIHQLLTAALVLGLFLVSSQCRADPQQREGFYFQLASGMGWMSYRNTLHQPNYEPHEYTTRQHGPGITGSLLLGYQLWPGLALGIGGVGSAHLLSEPNAHTPDGERVIWETGGGPYLQYVGTFGPFVDYYPSAALGWHVQALVGYASLAYADHNEATPHGIGLMAGLGHDWWLSKRWSIGALLRLHYANTHAASTQYTGGGSTPSVQPSVLTPSLDVTFTYH